MRERTAGIIAMVWTLAALCTTSAQQPELRYTFVKGRTYVYHRVFDQTNVQNNGAYEDSFVHSVVMKIAVEDVDSTGNGTLLCTVLEQGYRRKDEGEGTTAIQLSDTMRLRNTVVRSPMDEMPTQKTMKLISGRPDITPKFRVTLTPRGEYVSGEILEKAEWQKEHDEQLQNPNVRGEPVNPDRLLKMEIDDYFPHLPMVKAARKGETWRDSSSKVLEGKVIGGPGGSYFEYVGEVREYICSDGLTEDSITCDFLIEHMQKAQRRPSRIDDGYSEHTWDGTTRTAFRTKDNGYLGYETITTSQSVSKSDEDESPRVTSDSKFIVRLTLLKEE
ncbi:MAG: hypothetical protein HY962_12385 [Ignavibacteriae bacterium]|nr:hypothetical protein [Ignavibacteriota bacterium]